jgi:hypothetical protein
METIKNYIIAGLGALLVLSVTIQPAQSAGKSKEAKTVEYQHCMSGYASGELSTTIAAKACSSFRP